MNENNGEQMPTSPDNILAGLQKGENPVSPLLEIPQQKTPISGLRIVMFNHGGSCVSYDCASVIRNEVNNASFDKDEEAILRELKELHYRLKETEPMIASAIADLREAVKERNKSRIADMVALLSSGGIRHILAALASKSLLAFLGIC